MWAHHLQNGISSCLQIRVGESRGLNLSVQQDLWWESQRKEEVNPQKTSHLRCFVSILQFTIVKKKRGVVHRFPMPFCKVDYWFSRVNQNPQPYITPLQRVLRLLLLRNSKKGMVSSIPSWLHLPLDLDIDFKRNLNNGTQRTIVEFLPLYPPLISPYLYWTTRELQKESTVCDKGLWKTSHPNDVQRVTDKYQQCILEQMWVSPQIRCLCRLPCWISLEEENIHYIPFDNVPIKKSYRETNRSFKDAERLPNIPLQFFFENTQNQNFKASRLEREIRPIFLMCHRMV